MKKPRVALIKCLLLEDWRWELRAANGATICERGGFKTKRQALLSARRMLRAARGA